MRRLLLVGLVILGLGAAALVLTGRRGDAPATRPYSIVLITIDTLRADRVGRGLTPVLDALAASGRQFTAARATVPLTLPSHVTIMTGTLPTVHGVRSNGLVFGGGVPTMAQLLRKAGYRTGAFVGAYVLDRRFGLAEGFEVYDDHVPRDPDAAARLEAERPAVEVVDAALRWLPAAGPVFLWVHLYDPHVPYTPPAEHAAPGRHPYDGEVAYADAEVGRLVEGLRGRGLLDDAVIVVAGDHGEGLGEQGEETHGMLAYDTTLRVPLIVRAPGLREGAVATPVSLGDLAASVLRRVGVYGLSPHAGRADMFGAPAADGDVYAETEYPRTAGWHPLAVLAGEQWKLVRSSVDELYDLRADPGETRNLAAVRPAVVQGMSSRLDALRAEGAAPERAGEVSLEAAERLRALGYVSGSAAAQVTPGAPNPAAEIDAWTQFEEALALVTAKRAAEALPTLASLARRYPDGPVFQSTYARALQDAGNPAAAVKIYRAAVARWPGDAALFHDLAVAARAAGDRDEAMRAEQAALAVDNRSPAALNGLGLLHADAGRPADAAAAFERAASLDPSNPSYWANLGNARRELGDPGGAESAYRRALDVDPAHPDAANGLGVLLVQAGRAGEAISWFERALGRSPDFHEARLNLGIAYQESGNLDKAAAMYRAILGASELRGTREYQAAAELLRGLR